MVIKNKAAVTFFIYLALLFTVSQARSIFSLPKPHGSFKINITQSANQCAYTVTITTSCSSTRHTRDQISLSFGDAYGNQVYAPRIDDPNSRAFESCSTDTFQINGPCTHQVCYLYVYRYGRDGWKPKAVTVSGYYSKPVSFYYNTFIPNGVWFGFNYCSGSSSASA